MCFGFLRSSLGQLQTTFTGTEVKERVELYPHATSVTSWQVMG